MMVLLRITSPLKLMCLDTWSLVSKAVWEELGSVALLEEVCHWGVDLKVSKDSAMFNVFSNS